MIVEEVVPAMITQPGGFLGRADDVRKEHRGKHAIYHDWRPRTGQKLLDRIGDVAGIVADKGKVVYSRKLDIAGVGNTLGEKSSALHVNGLVVGSVDDERGHPNRRDNFADIDQAVHAHVCSSRSRADAYPLVLGPTSV